MQLLTRAFRFLGYAWATVVCVAAAAYVLMLWQAEGFSRVQELLSPFNIVWGFAILLLLAPGIGLLMLADFVARRRAPTEEEARELLKSASTLAADYGAVLERVSTEEPFLVADSSRLPAPKDKIEAALLLLIRVTEDKELLGALKHGFLSLASFQPGVGDRPVRIIPMPGETTEGALKEWRDEVVGGETPRFERWTAVSNRESERLQSQLRAIGQWDDQKVQQALEQLEADEREFLRRD